MAVRRHEGGDRLNIRAARVEDREVLRGVRPTLTEEIITERLQRQTARQVEFLVLEKCGVIRSFILLKWGGKRTHPEFPDMEDLYTVERERGKGYGSRLVAECEQQARAKGFAKIGLAVNPDNNPLAKALYERLGYRHDGKERYLDGVYDGNEDWVMDMEKVLGGSARNRTERGG